MLKKALLIFVLLAFVFTGYVLVKAYPDFKSPPQDAKNGKPTKIEIEFWGLWDNSDEWSEIIEKYENKTHEFNGQKFDVSINYTKKDLSSYRDNLLESNEKNKTPNIFFINSSWLPEYIEWLEPLKNNNAIAEEYDLLKYEEILDIFYTESIRNLIRNGQLYSFPMYSDSLALYYNKKLFEKAGIKKPPETWKEFKEATKKLTKISRNNGVAVSGAVLGSGKNINRSSDILSLLIMQGGGKVIDEDKNIDINSEIEVNTTNGTEERNPGKQAIIFYTEFSDPEKEIYSWNLNQEESIKSFSQEKSAMMFNYSYQIKNLLAMNPGLDYGISKMPQLEDSSIINFSSSWVPVVSKQNNCKPDSEEEMGNIDCSQIAWNFLSFATQKENAKLYSQITQRAAARKDLLSEQINLNDKISIFALQAESAINYNKFDDKIDEIIVEMLDEIEKDRNNFEEKINIAVEKIEKLK